MPHLEPLSDELLSEAVEALKRANGNKQHAADALGLKVSTYKARLKIASRRGYYASHPAMPGFEIVEVKTKTDAHGNVTGQSISEKPERDRAPFSMPEGHRLTGVSAYLDSEGMVSGQWVKTKEGQLDPVWIAERIRDVFEGMGAVATPQPSPDHTDGDLLNLFPCNDWHINMLAWSKEVGESWDLDIAERVIGQCISDVIQRSPKAAKAIILGGGDLLHADTNENRTAKSGNALDSDTRHQKALEVACRLKVNAIDAALAQHEHVLVRILSGNHDEYSSVAVAYFLLAYYRSEPRVTVDVDPSLFFWHRFGKVMLGATHGHTVKLKDMPQIMAHRRAEDWGVTRFRYCHGFHIHHHSKIATEGEGVICESHQAPVPQDAWHFAAGFLSGRSMQSITYHRERGEVGRVRVSLG